MPDDRFNLYILRLMQMRTIIRETPSLNRPKIENVFLFLSVSSPHWHSGSHTNRIVVQNPRDKGIYIYTERHFSTMLLVIGVVVVAVVDVVSSYHPSV